MQHYYVLKRKFNNTYYTVRNERNIPSIMAFPYAKPAKNMLKTILSMEMHIQPVVVQKIDEATLINICRTTSQPVLLFNQGMTIELDVSSMPVNVDEAKWLLEMRYRYH